MNRATPAAIARGVTAASAACGIGRPDRCSKLRRAPHRDPASSCRTVIDRR